MATTRTERHDEIPTSLFAALEDPNVPAAAKVQLMNTLRGSPGEMNGNLDRYLIERITRQHAGLLEAKGNIAQVKALLDQMSGPPLVPARFLGHQAANGRSLAHVTVNNQQLIVNLSEGVDAKSLDVGDDVVLNQKQAVLVGKNPFAPSAHGPIGRFDRMLADGRMVIRVNNEEVIVGTAKSLVGAAMRHGDLVRYDAPARLALEQIQPDDAEEFHVEAVEDLPLKSVGGQKKNLDKLVAALTLGIAHPGIAAKYQLNGGIRAILMHGRPGTGKTLMARVAAARLQKLLGKRAYLSIARPGQFENEFVGVTQRRMRECFSALRKCDGFGMLVLDEIETIARARGGPANHHRDAFLGALLVELQGMQQTDSPVAVVAMTNRIDLLDPALVSRMETQLAVDPPDQQGAREIFAIHLAEEAPYRSNGHSGAETRLELIDRAMSLFYSPNGSGTLCIVKMRDGSQRELTARELMMSGRCIAQVCRAARQSAAEREIGGGEPGLELRDIEEAIVETKEKFARGLSRFNIGQYVTELRPEEVIAVEPVTRRVWTHRYLTSDRS